MSKVQVDTIDTRSGTSTMQIGSTNTSTINIGVSGDTVNIPSGVTIANAGTATGFGEVNTPIFMAKMTSQQTGITRNTFVKVNFTTEVVDSDGAYNTGEKKFTVPSGKAGKYLVTLSVPVQMPSYDPRAIQTAIYKNGSKTAFSQHYANETDFHHNEDNTQPLTTILNLSVGDYLEPYIWIYQADGGTGQVADNEGAFFQGFRITS